MCTASELTKDMKTTELRAYDDSMRPRGVVASLTETNGCDCVSIGGVCVELHALREALREGDYILVRLAPDCRAYASALRAAAVRLGVTL